MRIFMANKWILKDKAYTLKFNISGNRNKNPLFSLYLITQPK